MKKLHICICVLLVIFLLGCLFVIAFATRNELGSNVIPHKFCNRIFFGKVTSIAKILKWVFWFRTDIYKDPNLCNLVKSNVFWFVLHDKTKQNITKGEILHVFRACDNKGYIGKKFFFQPPPMKRNKEFGSLGLLFGVVGICITSAVLCCFCKSEKVSCFCDSKRSAEYKALQTAI